MRPLHTIYKNRFFRNRYRLKWRAPHVCNAVKDLLLAESVIDVGCATGDLVAEYHNMGIRTMGIEGAPHAFPFWETDQELLCVWDLRVPFDSVMQALKFDVATCFEVAEHIEPEYADIFVSNLTGLSDRILMSIAVPGQGGLYHVNCQPSSYWESKMVEVGLTRVVSVEKSFRKAWKPYRSKEGIRAFYENLMYFQKIGGS